MHLRTLDGTCSLGGDALPKAHQRAFEMGKIRLVEVEDLNLRRTICLVSHRQRASTPAHLRFYEFVSSPAGQSILHRLGVKGVCKT